MTLNIYQHAHLPIRQTTKASSIETKKVVALLTGKWIHSMKIENDVFLSPDLYRKIKQSGNL